MNTFSIKSIVSIANVMLYTALVIIFVALGIQKWELSADTVYKLGYVLISIALAIFLFYHFIRVRELKTTPFQLLRKHKIYMHIFYIGQYGILIISYLYFILANTNVLSTTGIAIFWYVWFPTVFLLTITISVLESIVRVEERIFKVKMNWKNSMEWEKSQEPKIDNLKETELAEPLETNPFLEHPENKKE